MSLSRALRRSMILCAASALLLGCDGKGAAPTSAPASSRPQGVANDVIATVNGAPIREADVLFRLKSDSHQNEMKPEYRKNLLDGIIREQLVYERAVQLGLDKDANYQDEVRKLDAQMAAVKRKALGELFYQQEIAGKAQVSDAEAKKYFEDHAEWFRTDLHVLQILRRSEASIRASDHGSGGRGGGVAADGVGYSMRAFSRSSRSVLSRSSSTFAALIRLTSGAWTDSKLTASPWRFDTSLMIQKRSFAPRMTSLVSPGFIVSNAFCQGSGTCDIFT